MFKTSYDFKSFNKSFQSQQNKISKIRSHNKILQLFIPPQSEVFQLQYLYNSTHAQNYPEYREILSILQNYNKRSNQILQKGAKDLNSNQNIITRYCMKFLYKEMLSISVMNQKQIQNNNYALKLKNWNFFDGIHVNKTHFFTNNIEELIRKSYVSNVYDEIDDYVRKKIFYLDEKYKQTNENNQEILKQSLPSINLPLIDIQLYNRELLLLKDNREKKFDNKYLDDIKRHKNKVRENQMQNIRNKQFKIQKLLMKKKTFLRTQQEQNQMKKSNQFSEGTYKNKSFYRSGTNFKFFKDFRNSQEGNLNNSKQISNVNGINLINSSSFYIGGINSNNNLSSSKRL